MIRTCRLLPLLLAAGALPLAARAAAPPTVTPNILILVADDLGWTDLRSFGSSFYDTPNLDRLTSEGMKFTQAYAACPVCSPTRAALLTGRWPQRTGVTDYIGAAQPEKWMRPTALLPAPYRERLDREEVTIAEMLKPKGYATFFAGKWHLGPMGSWPEDQGFDINKGGTGQGGPYGGGKYFSPYGNPRLEDGPPGEHLPDRLATETARFISDNRNRPFLAWLSFYDVHTPLMAREDLRRKYEQRAAALPPVEPAWGQEGERQVRLVQNHAVYAGMVEAMDQAVGKVLQALDAAGLRDRTLVVFTSDNGGLSTSEGHPTSNLPLRAGKGWLYEGGVRVPMILRWPGHVVSGSTSGAAVNSIDLVPTLLAATGTPAPRPLDGRDMGPLLRGKGAPERDLCWHYPHYGNQGGSPGGAIRAGDWKLIEFYETGRTELYHLPDDPGEHTDLASKHPERAAGLLRRLRAWRAEVGAVMPLPNPRQKAPGPSAAGSPGLRRR